MYHIQTENVYSDMFADRAQFDFGSYPPNSTYFDATNDKLIGKFKDETSGDPILEFIGLRPKMYSFITVSDENNAVGAIQKEKHRAKGIQFAAQRALRHRDYAQQLDQPTITSLTNRRIGAKSHRLFTIETDKRALCSYDDKRFLLDDNITSLAYGHKDIPAGALETIEEEGDDADLVTVQQPRAADESDQEDDSELNNIETGSAAGPSTSSTVCSSFICAFIFFSSSVIAEYIAFLTSNSIRRSVQSIRLMRVRAHGRRSRRIARHL